MNLIEADGAATLRLGITGMSCASCAKRVATALETLPGVRGASANAATEQASLTLDFPPAPAARSLPLEQAGYQRPARDLALPHHRHELRLLRRPGRACLGRRAGHRVGPGFAGGRAGKCRGAAGAGFAGSADRGRGQGRLWRREAERGDPARTSSTHPSPWPALAAALLLTLPLLLPMLLAPFGLALPMLPTWLALALAAPVQLVLGARFYRAAVARAQGRRGQYGPADRARHQCRLGAEPVESGE